MRSTWAIELSVQQGGHALAMDVLAFLRDADRRPKTESSHPVTERLEAIARAATELIEQTENGDASANPELLDELRSLRGAIDDHPGEGVEVRRELDALIARLRERYEALAAALREDAVEVPRLRPTNYLRNAFHVGWGLFGAALILSLSARPWVLVYVALGFAAAGWTMELLRRRSQAFNAILMRAFRHVSHPHEAHEVNSSTWYASALALLALTREPTVMLVGVVVLTFADPAAALVGRRFGRINLVNGRTLEGSLTFAVIGALATFAALSLAGGLLPDHGVGVRAIVAATAGVLGAAAELVSRRVDDNFSIPVAAALGAWLILLAV